jgi:2-desacetyl-2-hydroxyethyl bacteriochlorophyllide A dehydrogenase
MKAIVKATAEAGSLRVVDLDIPKPEAGDVLVRIHATGICHTDETVLRNEYVGRRPVPVPVIMGHEAAGEIVEVGAGGDRGRIGERVALEPIAGCGHCHQCVTGHQNMCANWEHIGLTRDGTFAEYIVVPARQAHRVDDSVDYEIAAMTEPFGLVARTLEQVRPMVGETAAIVGPGPIGIMHLLAFKAAGLSKVVMVGLAKDEKRFELARSLGADRCIAVDRDDAVEAIKGETGGAGADIVVETASSPKAATQCFELAAPRGRVSLFGLYRTAEFSPLQMMRKGITAYGDVAQLTHHFIHALRIMAGGAIDFRPLVTHITTLENAEEGFAMARGGDAVKVVFRA